MTDYRPEQSIDRAFKGFPWSKRASLTDDSGTPISLTGSTIDSLFVGQDGAMTNLNVTPLDSDGIHFTFGQDDPEQSGEWIVTVAEPGALPLVYWWGRLTLEQAP